MMPAVYVLVTSDYTLPLYEACLAREPEHIVLLVSENKTANANAQRLKKLLAQTLPSATLHQPESKGLKGDDMAQDSQWVNRVLRPYLEQPLFAGHKFWLNLNGGTKSFSQVLSANLRFDYLDYRAIGSNSLSACSLDYRQVGTAGAFCSHPDLSCVLPKVSPIQVAQLYNEMAKESSANPLREHPQSLALAQRLFSELADEQSALSGLFALLNDYWSAKREDPSTHYPSLSLALNEAWPHNTDELKAISQLCPEAFYVQSGKLYFPGNAKLLPQAQHFKRWLSGDWLEQLGRHWLIEAGLELDDVSGNLAVEQEQGHSASGHEADLFVHHKGKSLLIEIKADLPQGHSATKLADEFNGNQSFGKVSRALLLGPVLKRKLAQDNSKLEKRCQTNSITLLFDQENVKALFTK